LSLGEGTEDGAFGGVLDVFFDGHQAFAAYFHEQLGKDGEHGKVIGLAGLHGPEDGEKALEDMAQDILGRADDQGSRRPRRR
jgi:hypothetical protein